MTFEPEELALLEAIHASPKEDTPRLVWADWLDEHGQAHYAEFIRLQCQQPYVNFPIVSKGPSRMSLYLPEASDPKETYQTYERGKRLKELVWLLYKDRFFPVPTGAARGGYFSRGLPIYEAVLTEETGAATAIKLTARMRPTATFRLDLSTISLTGWVDLPVMRRATVLQIRHPRGGDSPLSEADILALAESQLPDRLDSLSIRRPMTSAAEVIYRSRIKPRVRFSEPW